MPRLILIHDVDDDVYHALVRRSADFGLSVPEYLRKEIKRLAAGSSVDEWLERTRRRPGVRSGQHTLDALDELRGA